MLFKRSLVAAAVSAAPALATKNYKINAYWGQVGVGDTLAEYCKSDSIDYITLAFVNNSPENGGTTHFPGSNFAAHCAADVYVKDGTSSKLLSGCSFIKDDIKTCQALGKKVLISIGGEMTWQSNYTVSTVAEGEYFADFMFNAFGPYQESWTGPRPFDISQDNHTCIDGFDFDIEQKFDNQEPYVAMVNKLRELISAQTSEIFLTAAPQCPLADEWFQMKTILTKAQFDKIWIQFYNNDGCDATTTSFNYNDWETFIETTVNKDAELFVGLPGSFLAVGSGYITPETAKEMILEYRSKKHFGGIMLWDAYYASQNVQNSKTYYDSIYEALHYGEVVSSSSSYVVSSIATSASSSYIPSPTSTYAISSPVPPTVSSTYIPSSAVSMSSSAAVSTPSSSHSEAPTPSSSDPSSSGYDELPTSSSSVPATSPSVIPTAISSVSSSYVEPSTLSSSAPVSSSYAGPSPSSSSFYFSETSSPTITSVSSQITSSYGAYPTGSDDDDEDNSTCTDEETSSSFAASPILSSPVTTPNSSAPATYPTTSASEDDDDSCTEDETSSSYAAPPTSDVTVTTTSISSPAAPSSVAPWTKSSSAYPAISSSYYAAPETAPATGPSPSYPGSIGSSSYEDSASSSYAASETAPVVEPPPAASSSPTGYATSTLTTTHVYTITSCAPTITNCPVGVVTSEIVEYTTICPVTVTETERTRPTAVPTYPAGGPGDNFQTETKPIDTPTYPVGGNGDSDTTKTRPAVVPTYPAGSSGGNGQRITSDSQSHDVSTYPSGSTGGNDEIEASSTQSIAVPTYPAGNGADEETSTWGAAAITTYPSGGKGSGEPASSGFLTTIVIPIYPTKNGTVLQTGTSYIVTPTQVGSGSTSTKTSSLEASSSIVTAGSARNAAFSLGGLLLAAVLAL